MNGGGLAPLPIDPFLPEIAARLRERRALVVVAPPGAGKTTRVAPALAGDGPLLLLQPRRIAARSLARRIAEEQEWTLGEEVGWQVRFERRFTPRTRLLVATEGILTARLQSDPLLSGFTTVVLDEFHERTVHADLALALAREALRARDDLRLVVMSATLDAGRVADYLGGCPVVEAPGRLHPVAIRYAPELEPVAAIREALGTSAPGEHLLVFLPGAPEIRRIVAELGAAPWLPADTLVLPLHGSLDAAEQDRALQPFPGRKVILATNLAETSLTVEGVVEVLDTGLHKVLRVDPALGLDRLETERIPRDSAEQRAGRAGRTGPGRATRLWDPRLELRAHRQPELQRVDLAGPFLTVLAWGADPLAFGWFDPPAGERAAAALAWLERLGAARGGRVTPLGRRLARLPLHPRLARVLVEAAGAPAAAAACAVLAEGWRPRADGRSTRSDLLSAADRLREAPAGVQAAARELAREARDPEAQGAEGSIPGTTDADQETILLRALLAGYPDRVARRRAHGSDRLLLASGHGAVQARESGVRQAEFLIALEVAAAPRGAGQPAEALVRLASAVEREWLVPTRTEVAHFVDASGAVRAVERSFYEELVIEEHGITPDPAAASELLAAELRARGFDERGALLLRRLRFAGLELDLDALLRDACRGRTTLPDLDLAALLPRDLRRRLDTDAPETLALPSGRRARLDYREDGTIAAPVKLQELFGLAETPRLGPRREPVVFQLLAPNGRPVQTTRDLRSFWERTYPEVRKELRARYPKHPWPEDPWTAEPTHRTRRRS